MSLAIGQIVIVGIASLASFAFWICSKVVSKIHKDPARSWIRSLRSALVLLWIAGLFSCVVWGLRYSSVFYYSSGLMRLFYVLSAFSGLFFNVAQALIFLMFIDLVAGLSFIKSGAFSKKARNAQLAGTILMGIIIMLSVVTFALLLAMDVNEDSDMSYVIQPHYLRLDAALVIINLIVCVVAFGVAIGTVIKFKNVPNARSPSSFFLGAAITNMIPHVYIMAYLAQYGTVFNNYPYAPAWTAILYPILQWYPTVVVLIVMFALAAKKNPGMWTVAQPMSGPQYVYQQPQWYGQPQQQPYGQQPYGQPQQQYSQYNGNYQQHNIGWQQQPMAQQYDQPTATSPVNRQWEMSSTPSQQWGQPVAQNHVTESK